MATHKQHATQSTHSFRSKNETKHVQQQLRRIPIGISAGMLIICILSYLLFAATASWWVVWICFALFVVSLWPAVQAFRKTKHPS